MKNVPFVHPLSPRAREKFLEWYASVCSFLELLLFSILIKIHNHFYNDSLSILVNVSFIYENAPFCIDSKGYLRVFFHEPIWLGLNSEL